MMELSTAPIPTFKWWESRRLKYNYALAIAGIAAFICYATIGWTVYQNKDAEFEITGLTVLFNGVCHLVMMFIANICFLAGPIAEKLIRPSNINAFRQRCFALGWWISVLLPFTIPLLLLIVALTRPYPVSP